jgi:uncharacterized cupredoxin-like copper-binding protein
LGESASPSFSAVSQVSLRFRVQRRAGRSKTCDLDFVTGSHMTTRKMLQVVLTMSIALGAASIGSAAFASPGHDDDDGAPAVDQQAPEIGMFGTADAPRDIAVTMTDTLRFDPGTIVVAEGETIRFLLDNPTVAPHDFLIGDLEEQQHHTRRWRPVRGTTMMPPRPKVRSRRR